MARKAAESNPETESIEQLLAGKRPKRVTPERLEQLLRDWPDHAGTKLYCYRIRPEVDFSQVSGKKGTNVAILMAPFPEDLRSWFIENHGGGKYEIKFNDANQPFTNIVTCFIDIPNSEADPILDVRTLVRGGNENEQLIQKWLNDGTIAKDAVGQLMPAATAAGHAQPAGDGTPQSVIDLMTHTYKKSFDMAIQQNDPMKMLEVLNQIKGENKGLDLPMLVMLIKALQPPPPPPAPPPDTSVAIMLKSLSDQNTLLLTKLLEPKPENSGSGLSQVKELLEVMGTMRDELAPLARGARGGGGWQETLRALARNRARACTRTRAPRHAATRAGRGARARTSSRRAGRRHATCGQPRCRSGAAATQGRQPTARAAHPQLLEPRP